MFDSVEDVVLGERRAEGSVDFFFVVRKVGFHMGKRRGVGAGSPDLGPVGGGNTRSLIIADSLDVF